MKPLHVFVLTALCGFGLAVAAVYILAGLGWSLLAGAGALFLIAGFVRRGLTGE
ncbi:hypothetical protein IMW75_13580 [Pseudomonas gregormendelii]|uniref:Uncharacterized protein n=1 Tax=Pseudomonas gregormendelii TaxID=1628277 RepID=A0ABS3AHA1_9PSED|nr:hypothetical protein [Pseudomonas gregormendelii]MBN3966303.1 hypothetical protein [Pseudomonas gregormendelii]